MGKQMGEPMTVSEAIEQLTDDTVQSKLNGDGKALIKIAVDKLKAMQTLKVKTISATLQEVINKAPRSKSDSITEEESRAWAEEVYHAVYAQSRFRDCKDYLKGNEQAITSHTIDGETSSKWIGNLSNLITVVAFVVISAFNMFQNDDGTRNYDKASTYVGLIIACVGLALSFICWLWNRRQKKKIAKSGYSYEELLAARYSDSNSVVQALLPQNVKTVIKNNKGNINSPGGAVINGCFNHVDR